MSVQSRRSLNTTPDSRLRENEDASPPLPDAGDVACEYENEPQHNGHRNRKAQPSLCSESKTDSIRNRDHTKDVVGDNVSISESVDQKNPYLLGNIACIIITILLFMAVFYCWQFYVYERTFTPNFFHNLIAFRSGMWTRKC